MSFSYCVLPDRRVLSVSGEDRIDFLQGLVSNDVRKVSETNAVYAAFLTPQGKFLCDFFIIAKGDSLLIDIAGDVADGFKKKLTMYKLRAKVAVADVSEDYDVLAVFDGESTEAGLWADPRLPAAGYRAILAKGQGIDGGSEVPFETYDLLRIKLGLPDGTRDMTPDKSILLENGFDELNGVDWNKGCYMGQELTARTKYRALIKKRLIPVSCEDASLQSGDEVVSGDKVVGEIHSCAANMGLATLRLEALEDDLSVNGKKISVHKPDWMVLPA